MNRQHQNYGSYQNFGNKSRKTWLSRLLRWTWKTTVLLISITIRVALSIIWITANLVVAFFWGMISFDSMKSFRRQQRAKGDFRW